MRQKFTDDAEDDAYSAIPAATYDPTNEVLYLVSNYNGWYTNSLGDNVGALAVYSISGPVGSAVFTNIAFADNNLTGDYNPPWESYSPTYGNFAPQLGSTNKIDTGDARIKNVVFRNGSVWAAHTIFEPINTPTHSAVQWWEVTPGGTVVQRGRVEDPFGNVFYAFPSIAVSLDNDTVIGYSRFSASQYPGANYSFRRESDLFSALRGEALLKAGESAFTNSDAGRNRWGRWSATVIDPDNDEDIWTLQEYTATPTNGVRHWGTWWGRVSPPRNLGVSQSDAPDPVAVGAPLT